MRPRLEESASQSLRISAPSLYSRKKQKKTAYLVGFEPIGPLVVFVFLLSLYIHVSLKTPSTSTKSNMTELPVISIQPYLPSTSHLYTEEDRLQSAKAIHIACKDVGFFFLDVQGFLQKDEMDEVLNLGRQFFASSQEEKDSIGLKESDGVRGGLFVGEAQLRLTIL